MFASVHDVSHLVLADSVMILKACSSILLNRSTFISDSSIAYLKAELLNLVHTNSLEISILLSRDHEQYEYHGMIITIVAGDMSTTSGEVQIHNSYL